MVDITSMSFEYKGYYCHMCKNSGGGYFINVFNNNCDKQAIYTYIAEDVETLKNEAKNYIDGLKDDRKYPPDLAYQISKVQELLKEHESKNTIYKADVYKLAKQNLELTMELAKQHNKEG